MQSSLASPPLFAGLDDLYEPVDVQQLQDDSPLLLQEEMLDLMNMNPVFGAGDEQTTLYQAPPTSEAGNGQPLVHIMDMDEDEYADDDVTPLEQPPVTMRARPSTIGRMLFPSRSIGEKAPHQRAKRLSAPIRSAHTATAPIASPASRRLSLPASSATVQRQLLNSTVRPGNVPDAALLALPAAKQLQSEKTRLRELQTVHAQQQDAQVQATERIQELEQALEKARLEQEGWQAEAQQLAARLEAAGPSSAPNVAPATPDPLANVPQASDRIAELERALALESSKRRRGKELQSKLRCELVNRRWKEKWEVELLERVERELEIKIVQLEAQVVLDEYEREMERLERAEAEENLALQTRQVANLTASRQILLTSFRTSEHTVATLRSDLSSLRSELDASASASAQRIGELEVQVEELDEVKDELAAQRKELERLEKGGKKGDLERQKELEKERKELEKERKELEKERSKREKLESEVKALKTQLKTTESALKAAEKAKASQAKAALSRSSSIIKATPHPTSDVEQDVMDQHEGDAAVDEPVDDAAESDAVEPEPETEEAYKPSKSKSRSAPAPKPAAAAKEPKKGKATAVEVEAPAPEAVSEASEAESAPPTPKKAADPPKKRKADVLGDKSTNARASQRGDEGAGLGLGLKVKKAKKAADGSKVSALALAFGGDSDDDSAANNKSKKSKKKRGDDGDGDEGQLQKKQSKKRTLLGPRKKFDWTAESANIDSMIPIDLSPIKKQPGKKTTGLFNSFLSGPPTKASFF